MKKSNGANIGKNEKILLWIVGIISICALCYILIISPAQSKWKPKKDEIESLDAQLEAVKNIDNEIAALKNDYEKLKTEYDKATVSLPKSDKYPQIFKDIEDMAKACGIDSLSGNFGEPKVVTTVSNDDSSDSSNKKKDEDTVSLEGMKSIQVDYSFPKATEGSDPATVEKVLAFVDKLENYERISHIGKIQENQSGFQITIYFYELGEDDPEEKYEF